MTVSARPPRSSRVHRLDPSWAMLLYAVAVAVSPEFDFLGVEKVRVSDLILPVLLLLFMGARATEVRRNRRNGLPQPRGPIPLLGPMGILLLWDLASYAMFSEEGPLGIGAMYLAKRAEFFVVYFMGVMVVTSEWAWERIIRLFVLAAPILNLSVLWELHSKPELHRASGIIRGQETSTALFIVVVLGLVMGAWPVVRRQRERWALMLAAGTGMAALLATASRAGLLCALLVAFLQAWRERRRRLGMLAGLILITSASWFLMPQTVQDRFERVPDELTSAWRGLVVDASQMPSAGSSSVAARILIAQRVLSEVIPRSPVFGLGTGRLVLGLVDNMYLTEWIYHGLVGLALLVVFLWTMGSTLKRIRNEARDPLLQGLAGALLTVLVAFSISGLAAETFYLIRPMEAYMLLVGVVVGRSRLPEVA